MSGLERLEIEGRIWELGVNKDYDGTYEAIALSETENRLWRVFPSEFRPSKEAIACFLEHRKIQSTVGDREQVYTDAARVRRVLGVLPLDNDGMPAPPSRGGVYATLPTEDSLPFGLHINADWLLNISRSGLREIEDNAWQRDIAETITVILTQFLKWSANRHPTREAAKSAFKALGQPSTEAGGLESLLAEKSWLSLFRDQIRDASIVPVWTEPTDNLAYAKPVDCLVPPAPMAKLFAKRPELRPAKLLNRHVLVNDVLGHTALGLLRSIGLVSEMSPKELENIWMDGIEDWWKSVEGDKQYRRELLFRLWATIAELADHDAWRNLSVRCVRTVTGEWVSVKKASFINEPLATNDEPGGRETRRLMKGVISNANRLGAGWVNALRRSHRKHQYTKYAYRSRAWNWIQNNARSIGLREIVKDALITQIASPEPDWSMFISLGHWAKHRNRPDLLSHVLVQSNGGTAAKATGEALIADPYAEAGNFRRCLWANAPAIDGDYLENDPKCAGAHEWRTFFEKAGARGQLKVRTLKQTASRWERYKVAEFLGLDLDAIPECNDSGYSLQDFDIEPEIQNQDTSRELRAALGPLLADGFRALNGKGQCKISYFYYSQYELEGVKPSIWVEKLCDLAWVPCGDNELRHPREVLKEFDPAREEAPYAKLPNQFLDMLEKEGVKFGTNIAEAPSLRKLLTVGSKLDAKELAQLLSDCREHATTETERQLLGQAINDLELPTTDNQRIKLNRVVQRIGGRLRGSLGSWIVPLDKIDEMLRIELEDGEFPHKFPDTTTGEQALDYILDVWQRAKSDPARLANDVRDVLPTAYGYLLEDVDKQAALLERWQGSVRQAMVFSDRKWIAPKDVDNVYFDDIEDRRFLPKQGQFSTVTAGHLGRTRNEQLDTAEAIGLPRLSSIVSMNWIVSDKDLHNSSAWSSRFDLICDLLHSAKGSEFEEGAESNAGSKVRLFHANEIALHVSVDNFPEESVPVHARLHEGTLTVAGRPVQFGADAAKELLRLFSFGQRAGLAADLTGMFIAIEDGDFSLAAEKFRRSHAPAYDVAAIVGAGEADTVDESGAIDQDSMSPQKPELGEHAPNGVTPTSGTTIQFDYSPSSVEAADAAPHEDHDQTEEEHSRVIGGSYSRDRAMAKQNALARELRNSLKGEIVPAADEVAQMGATSANGGTGDGLGDLEYRKIVVRYEREAGRKPEPGDPHQSGWDVRSADPQTGKVRLIEVKGKGRPWDADEVVELSSAQVRKAFEATEHWYLYVVERVDESSYRVLVIDNPARNASKWLLCGESWRMAAEDVKVVSSTPD